VLLVAMQLVAAARTWALTYFAAAAQDPIPMAVPPGLRVALLTTIVPGKEPVDLVMTTLRAMTRVRHDGPVDVWLLDEGDDPEVRRRCAELGVRHFSRKGRPEWNQAAGPYRARTKHGNHNAWRAAHERQYDVVAQMDPDHVPYPNFLERTLGYFADPDTAFVVAPQVYGNLTESFVARGAAELAYLFHGIIQRGGNGRGAPLLIGTNHLYRPAAFDQIGGYQDCIIEDHLTSMVVYSATNPGTGNRWRGVYTPDILAVGEGPATYTDFFSQQKRWAYGIWQIARQHSPAAFGRMGDRGQRWSFVALQLHYPTAAFSWVAGVALSLLYLVGGVTVTRLPVAVWAALFLTNVVTGFLLVQFTRRFNLVRHERRSWGLAGMALELVTAPIYTAAAVAQLAGRPLAYVVTAKGTSATADGWRAFRPHAGWAALALGGMLAGVLAGHDYWSLYLWATITAAVCVVPMLGLARQRIALLSTRAAAGASQAGPAGLPVPVRRRVGAGLVAGGVITQAQLDMLLDVQATSDGPWLRLGELAVELGLATPDQVAQALHEEAVGQVA
jgi:Glycosyl transferase family group 2